MNLNFTLVLQIISFIALLGILTKVLYKPFMKYLDERTDNVKNLLEGAERDRKKAEEYITTSREVIRRAKEDALSLRETTARDADREKIEIIGNAKKEALSVLEKAELGIKKEIEKTKEEAKKSIAGIAVEIAKKILGREVKEKDHASLIKESLKRIQSER